MAGFVSRAGVHGCGGAGTRMMEAMPRRADGVRGIFSDEGLTLLSSGYVSAGTAHGGRPVIRRANGRTVTAALAGWLANEEELRGELLSEGQPLNTPFRAELAAAAYSLWGEGCFGRMSGSYALAVWENRRLTLACDAHGLRPLFYADTGHALVFATDMAALRAHPDVLPGQASELPPGGVMSWPDGEVYRIPPPSGRTDAHSPGSAESVFSELFRRSAARFPGARFWLENGDFEPGEGIPPRLLCPGLPLCRMRVIDRPQGMSFSGSRDSVITGQDAALSLLDAAPGMPDATRAESAGLPLCRAAAKLGSEALTAAGGAALFAGENSLAVARRLSRAEAIAAMAGLTLHPVFADPELMDFASSLSPEDRVNLSWKYSFEGDPFPTPDGPGYLHGLRSRLRAAGMEDTAVGADEAARVLMEAAGRGAGTE